MTLTGRKVLALFIGAFSVIIGVNLALAYNAVRTFPGLEVANSYVASQSFDDRKAAQEALAWDLDADYDGGILSVTLRDAAGVPVTSPALLTLGRPTEGRDDLARRFEGQDSWLMELEPGLWRVDVEAEAPDGTAFTRRLKLRVTP
ncbi:FixH family protein [Roseicyclus sp. F158]|uniref:FixH family protein n=1 Tax=Tropicimonas omnivorans TaxID=3075590 RepID=A0ABU3DCZ8_9RHOB|nr:FixH family protein [Roseicyclus sp. F158]MDT0681525.1 FixH family protein [Roseicyclus sp. F158]